MDTDGDGLLDTGPTKEFPILKVIKKNNGGVQLGRGSKRVVKGSYLEIIYPEYTVWEAGVTSYVYPFIFTSDSDWTVDVCTEVPVGYRVVGVYDANGDLISSVRCIHAGIAGEKLVVAFDVVDLQSPPPHVQAKLTVKHNGKVTKLDLGIRGHREVKDKPNQGNGNNRNGQGDGDGNQNNAALLSGVSLTGVVVLAGVGSMGWFRRKRKGDE